MREALYFRNISFSVKLDGEADVSKYDQIRPHIRRPCENMAGFRPGPDMISGATLFVRFIDSQQCTGMSIFFTANDVCFWKPVLTN